MGVLSDIKVIKYGTASFFLAIILQITELQSNAASPLRYLILSTCFLMAGLFWPRAMLQQNNKQISFNVVFISVTFSVYYSVSARPLRFFKNIEIKEMTIPINAIVLAAKNSDSVAVRVCGSGWRRLPMETAQLR